MKVAQEIDVDNVTIIINPQNKLEAKIPTTSSEVVIEEVPNVLPTHNAVVTLNGTQRRITKLGKVNGTEWLVFQLEIPKPLIEKNIRVEFYDNVGTSSDGGITFNHTGKVRVITADGSPFTPNGDSGYDNFMDSNLTMNFSGNTENLYGLNPIINFNTMTYSVDVSYRAAQTSSTLDGLGYMENVSFTAEHDEAIYKYYITSFSRGADTPVQPPVTDTSWWTEKICEQDEVSPDYDHTYTGVTLGGELPEGVTEVVITKGDGSEVRVPYSGKATQYKYNVEPRAYNPSKHGVTKVTLVTPQGNVSRDVTDNACAFISIPE